MSPFLWIAIVSVAFNSIAVPAAECDVGNRAFFCGVANAEDLVRVTGTPWIVVSHVNWTLSGEGMIFGAGPLRAINSATREIRTLFPSSDIRIDWDAQTYRDCSRPPKVLASHGLNIQSIGQGRFRLYVVNHGERESVEVIDLTVMPHGLQPTWRGCLNTPNGARADSVAPLSNGRVAVSLLRGAGPVIWSPNIGWTKISGLGEYDHGIEASRDGKWLFLVLHRQPGEVIRASVEGGVQQTILRTDFVPDNLRWGEDGQLYVAGFFSEGVKQCQTGRLNICDTGFAVERINPDTLKTEKIISMAGLKGTFGAATVALQLDRELWIGTWFGDRIAIFTLDQKSL